MAHKFGGRVGQLRAELAEAYLRVNELSKKEDQQFRRAEKAEAERDALKAAIERVRTIADQWIAQAVDNDQDELVPVLANVGRTILAALAAPETTEKPTPERRRELLRETTLQAMDAGLYGEPAPEMRPAPEVVEARCRSHPTEPCTCPDDQWDLAPETPEETDRD
jgi:multidrug resistance efflux pump